MRDIKRNNCEYFAISPPLVASGVIKKIHNIVDSLNSIGVPTTLKTNETNLKGFFGFITSIFKSRSEYIIIRFPGVNRTIFLFPFILLKRIAGYKIIIDLPTPLVVAMQEIRFTNPLLLVIYRWIPIVVFYPWAFIPYTRIIQSGLEHPYFLLLIKHKTKLIGNGINVSTIKKVDTAIHDNISKKITMICVAQLEIWHGYDRLLNSLKYYLDMQVEHKEIEVIIVGDGNERSNLEQLSNMLGLSNIVKFTGNLIGSDLDNMFSKSNIAVGSLGSYRVNLKTSSPLKTREYSARSLPFISADNDPDFPDATPFVFKVPNDESIIDIKGVITWYQQLIDAKFEFSKIREYAELELDFKHKVKRMFF